MQKAKCEIKGTSALLMHAYPMEPIEALEKKSKEIQAEYAAYRDPKNKRLFIPAICLQRALISAATYSKGKGRGSLQKNAAACVGIEPERLDLGISDYEIDSRPVVIAATKGRIIRHRPRVDNWSVKFEIIWDENLLRETEVKKILDDCGQRVGLLDFRPEKKGPFGKFMVTSWKTV